MIEILQGAARYVQGPGALSRMAQDLRGLESAFVVGGKTGLAAFLPAFRLEGARIETGEPLAGKSTWEQARALAERAVREYNRRMAEMGRPGMDTDSTAPADPAPSRRDPE